MSNDSNRARRSRPSRRSRHELLGIRKEIVLTRIAIERAEIAQAAHNTRERLRGFRWLKLLLPHPFKLGGSSSFGGLLDRYPYISSVASLALTGLSRTLLGRTARPLLKWGSLGLLAWQGVQLWQKAVIEGRAEKAAEAANANKDTSSSTKASPSEATAVDNGNDAPPLI